MREITIHRPKENYNQFLKCQFIVDGKRITELSNGEKKVVSIPENAGHVQMKIKYTGSEKLPAHFLTKEIVVQANKSYYPFIFTSAVIPLITAVIFLFPNFKPIGISLLMVLALGILFSLTLGKNNWLDLKLC